MTVLSGDPVAGPSTAGPYHYAPKPGASSASTSSAVPFTAGMSTDCPSNISAVVLSSVPEAGSSSASSTAGQTNFRSESVTHSVAGAIPMSTTHKWYERSVNDILQSNVGEADDDDMDTYLNMKMLLKSQTHSCITS